jgi:glycosyltransferase involved in cell wall biosynthesis
MTSLAPVAQPKSSEPGRYTIFRDDAFFVAYRYSNHAGPSGYDRFADYLGTAVAVSPRLRMLGETVLRAPGKLIGWYNGSYEYSRHDFIQELAVWRHMQRRRDAFYHFLYAEKSLRFLGSRNRRRGNRIIGSFHHCPFKYPLYFRSTRHFRNIEHAVVVSRRQIEHVESIVGRGKVSFVPYAVDADYFQPAETPNLDRPRRCACVGQHLRDFETLPQVIRGIKDAVPDCEFYVIGAPRRYESQIREIPGALWKHGISDEEYLGILQGIDLLVLPLIDSTSVTTVNEALACGAPVITNYGGVEDYLNEDCSVLRPVGDAAGMVEAAVELLREEGKRDRMSQAARRQGLELHWPRSAAKMRAVYDRVLGPPACSSVPLLAGCQGRPA